MFHFIDPIILEYLLCNYAIRNSRQNPKDWFQWQVSTLKIEMSSTAISNYMPFRWG